MSCNFTTHILLSFARIVSIADHAEFVVELYDITKYYFSFKYQFLNGKESDKS